MSVPDEPNESASTESPEAPPPSDGAARGWRLRDRLRAAAQQGPAVSEEQMERRMTERFSQHWAAVRAERREAEDRPDAAAIHAGPSNFSRAHVPWGVDLAAA